MMHGVGSRAGFVGREMELCFFGPPGRELFGVHYRADGPDAGRHGVVVCYPYGHEYVNSLRGCRQLSARLRRAGFEVLRFDYRGTGDSVGWGEDVTIDDWMEDIETAISELRRRHGLRLLTLVGIRLGASLAVMVGDRCGDIDGLVLWEPIVQGETYVAELRARHARFLHSEAAAGRSQAAYDSGEEIMGFPLSDALARQLAAIDLLACRRPPAPHVLVIEDRALGQRGAFATRLEALGARVDDWAIPGHKIWVREPGQERALVPMPIVEAVLTWCRDHREARRGVGA